MSRLPRGALNVMTVEDPIEFALDGVGQTQVNPRIELSFARALRSILRQDPDIIMIGEIRDLETAQIAVQASLTGHLVLATLAYQRRGQRGDAAVRHGCRALPARVERARRARAAPGALPVPGVPPRGAADRRASPRWWRGWDCPRTQRLYQPVGCAECGGSGYRGRTGVYELVLVDEALRRLIHDRAGEPALRDVYARGGGRTLAVDGARWLADGTTSLAELLRVSGAA